MIVKSIKGMSYVNTVLVSLFYPETSITTVLNNNSNNSNAVTTYLQEFIKHNFINKIKDGKSILEPTLLELQNILIKTGWEPDTSKISNISTFYEFLIKLFNGPVICTNINSDNVSSYINLYTPVNLNLNQNKISVQQLLTQNKTVIVNSPSFIALKLERTSNPINITVQKKISIKCGNYFGTDINHYWIFHTAICLHENNFYSLTYDKESYVMFDELHTPSLYKVDMKNKTVATTVEKECVLLIYRFLI